MNTDLIVEILKNPVILAALIAVIRNVGGYIYNCFEAKKVLTYNASDFLVTLGIWETFFVALNAVGGLPTTWTLALTTIVDVVRSLKAAIEKASA